jgi:hypothetical protein
MGVLRPSGQQPGLRGQSHFIDNRSVPMEEFAALQQ